jgi:demethylmenaquinone methyltransferase/2-methoxy-6-polyprenyl-1,4-benzoquinol methylase
VVPNYDEKYVADLFDKMGPSYDIMNLVSSFGFSEIWRAQCVNNLKIHEGAIVADLMSGSGECWTYLNRRIKTNGEILSVDISPVMCDRQKKRLGCINVPVHIRCESALQMKLPTSSVDFAISAFGLKTFNSEQLNKLAVETFRILRPGGSCSFIEISVPKSQLLRIVYDYYISHVIPLIGKVCLGDIDCYKMLGIYTAAFGSCYKFASVFENAGFEVTVKRHFFGCASSLTLRKKSISQ